MIISAGGEGGGGEGRVVFGKESVQLWRKSSSTKAQLQIYAQHMGMRV